MVVRSYSDFEYTIKIEAAIVKLVMSNELVQDSKDIE